MEDLEADLKRAEYMQSTMINRATGGPSDDNDYQELRKYFLMNDRTRQLIPSWISANRNLSQFWQFIKNKFPTYEERRNFIWSELRPLFNFLERRSQLPADQSVSMVLLHLNSDSVHEAWEKALERRQSDPEGAITSARTLLESICKHILDVKGVQYEDSKADLPQLYHLVSVELNLAPSQHTEEVFKQILGGCSSIVNGLSSLRNRLGDAHGKGARTVHPAARHAELAVNLAGSVALFLIETWESRNSPTV